MQRLGYEIVDGRYSVAMHGVGLCDEYPSILYPQDWEPGDDSVLLEGMAICVEGLAASGLRMPDAPVKSIQTACPTPGAHSTYSPDIVKASPGRTDRVEFV